MTRLANIKFYRFNDQFGENLLPAAVFALAVANCLKSLIGNLRTTTKFTTTTSVDRESTGTRTSVSAGNRKLKMQSLGRTTTALNVNKL